GAYCGNTVGEEAGQRPFIWEALRYPSGKQAAYMREFIMSEDGAYQKLRLATAALHPHKSKGSREDGLDGWAYMMRTPDKRLAMLYFENQCEVPNLSGFLPAQAYKLHWFNPRTGKWQDSRRVKTNKKGEIHLQAFPGHEEATMSDWALKIKAGKG
ncbi:hypothetical protein GF373_09035, partial [bacterium]|nr:hypothetical protein [bacterium]